ncbi:MAG: hypothetical protein JNK02_17815 [Planctomycetes bacterium]|nr:hypothetical protein [Planctomycetota bacterium]
MEVAASRPTRLLPLRFVAALLFLAMAVGTARALVTRHELLAAHPALNPKLLATLVAAGLVGALGLVFLAWLRQRFALWAVLGCLAAQLAVEVWAGFAALQILQIPLAAAALVLAARRAWPDLRSLT